MAPQHSGDPLTRVSAYHHFLPQNYFLLLFISSAVVRQSYAKVYHNSFPYFFEALTGGHTFSDLGEVLVFLIDVELMVDVWDLKELSGGGVTLLRCWAGMLGIPAFWGELQPILYYLILSSSKIELTITWRFGSGGRINWVWGVEDWGGWAVLMALKKVTWMNMQSIYGW